MGIEKLDETLCCLDMGEADKCACGEEKLILATAVIAPNYKLPIWKIECGTCNSIWYHNPFAAKQNFTLNIPYDD